MHNIWQKDGLSRRQRIDNATFKATLNLLNNELYAIAQKAFKYASNINYYNLDNKVDGTFEQTISSSIFLSLITIKNLDINQLEKQFLILFENKFFSKTEQEESLIKMLLDLIAQFNLWLINSSNIESFDTNLALRSDIVNQIVSNIRVPAAMLFEHCKKQHSDIVLPELNGLWKTKTRVDDVKQANRFYKSMFYKLTNSIETLQVNAGLYEQEIWDSGYNDPAIGLLVAFFINHNKVVDKFNTRWSEYSNFYLEKILLAKQAKATPDSTYLKIFKQKNISYLNIPKGTVFKTNGDIKFTNVDGFVANSSSLKKVLVLFEERDREIEPANSLNYVTSLQKNDLTDLIDRTVSVNNSSRSIFGDKGKKSNQNSVDSTWFTSVGLLIKSWSLLLREGNRSLNLQFIPTSETQRNLLLLIDDLAAKWNIPKQEAIYKLLNDIFYIEISTEEGWVIVDNVNVVFDSNSETACFNVELNFSGSFPPICAVKNSKDELNPPSLRVLINRDTWLFPYSWLKTFEFKHVKIKSSAKNISNIQIYSELGKLDTSIPFYPFGIMPKKGSWIALGCYEMSVKSIKKFNVNIRWTDLPDNDYGFAGYYSDYQKEINNCSFEINAQTLKNKQWISAKDNKSYYLFSTNYENGKTVTAPNAKLIHETFFVNLKTPECLPTIQSEQDYKFDMFTRNGYFRFVLANPSMGFGHIQFQKLLSDVLMQKVRSKKIIQTPNPPFAPQIEQITIDYFSEDDINLTIPSKNNHQIYHIHPFGLIQLNNSSSNSKFNFIPDFSTQGNILFGFDNIKAGDTLRIFVELLPQNKEIEKTDFPVIKWFYGNGYSWDPLPQNYVLKDDTRKFLETGIVEIKIPVDMPDLTTAMHNHYWLKASVEKNAENISEILSFHLHVIQVERVISKSNSEVEFDMVPALSINQSETKIPGLDTVIQLKNSSGGRLPENRQMMKVRLSERISHRNRAINALDYEKIILENFPTVRKVKCFPGLDSKGKRPGIVTLAIIEQNDHEGAIKTPKSNCKLLLDIEEFLKQYSSIFAKIDAINPEYEYLQVRCKVTLRETRSEGYYLRKLNTEINNYIAFWEVSNEAPVFGHSVSIIELANFIRSREYITRIENFSLVHLHEEREYHYKLEELEEYENIIQDETSIKSSIRILLNDKEIKLQEAKPVKPSKPWAILIPIDKHMLVSIGEKQNDFAGIDELEIGNTFVIK